MSDFHWQSNAFLWFDFKPHGLRIKEEKRKIILLREIYLLARCLMLNWSRTATYPDVSLPMKIGAQRKAGRRKKGRDGAKPPFFTLPNGPLHFVTSHSPFALASFRNHAKNEAPEEEAGSRRHAFTHATKHEIYGFFITVFRKFSRKNK